MQNLPGAPVAAAILERLRGDIDLLAQKNIRPKLAVIRVGESEDAISYERGIIRRFTSAGADVEIHALDLEINQDKFDEVLRKLNNNNLVHGILVFFPLPKHLSEDRVKMLISPEKDVDCLSVVNLGHLFACDGKGFAPCTPEAVIELLDYYNINLTGKKVAVIGRSLITGKPLAVLLISRNATVTVCHTKTVDLIKECRGADIIIACAGSAKMLKREFTHENQVIIDVGINMLDGKLCGDVDYENLIDHVAAITPVPGGVSAVTNAVLLSHVIKAAMLKF